MASLIGRVVISSFALHSFTRPGCPPFRFSERKIARSMSSGSTQRIFQLKLDPLTGNSEWIVVEEGENAENSTEIPLWSTSYLDMLNDNRRNRAFRRAIEKAITKPCHVLDIGAGTGLLSMIAAQAMDASGANGCASTKGRVSACESYLPMVKMMRKVLRINGMEKNIHVFHKRSDELKVGVELASRADILVSEILDSELLGEGLIPTLQHAHDMLLVENPCTIPYRATTYGQLVESPFLWKLHDLSSYEAKAFDSVQLAPAGLETVMCVKPQQYAMHCDAISEEIKLLSEPFKIFDIEFWKRPESHGETKLHIKITDDGRVHAVVSWWILQLDSEGTIFYSTAPKWISLPFEAGLQMQGPGDVDWCDHWKQCVWFIPGKGISVSKDEQVHFQAVHDDTSISYSLKKEYPAKSPGHYGHCTRDFSLTLSQERVAIYGDREWRSSMSRAVRSALQKKVSSLCVVADDSVFLTILVASLSKNLQVISLFPGLQENGTQYLQAVGDANGFSTDRVRVIDKRKTCLNLNFTGQKKIDLLVGEPFYYGNDGMLPWQNLRFWKERSMLDSVLAEDVLIMPCKGILKACAISLPDLWKSRRSLKMVEGFDHSIVNASLGACGELPDQQEGPCLPYFIWQCGQVKILSETCAVMEFDLLKSLSPCFGNSKLGFTKPGICHGFALWIDWVMDAENSIVLSTGPDQRYWKQGVKLLSKPIAVGARGSCREGESCSAVIDASFSPSNGELNINHAFT